MSGLLGLFKKARPNTEQALRRLAVLRHVAVYSLVTPPPDVVEKPMAGWSEAEQGEFRAKMVALRDDYWRQLRAAGLWSSLSPKELGFAARTAFTMTNQERTNAAWRTEAVMVLLWALGLRVQLLPYDTAAGPDLLKAVPPLAELKRSARLRPRPEIDKARDTAETWHWRSRTRELMESGYKLPADEKLRAAGINSLDDIVRRTADLSVKDGTLPRSIDGDFPVRGQAFRDLSAEQWSEVRSIVMERHLTLNWLCGYAPGNRWDETPTGT